MQPLQPPPHLRAPSSPGTPAQGASPNPSSPGPGNPSNPSAPQYPAFHNGIVYRVRRFMKQHHRKLWWLHSCYALALGVSVVILAQKGFDHARWLAVTLGIAWLIMLTMFRVFGGGGAGGADIGGVKAKIRFFAMTYVLKNLYQGMLFFLLPFYWKSTTFDSPNAWFIFLLAPCAVLSTLDVVFDNWLMRLKWLASIFHGVILFGCLNVVIPALFPDTQTLISLLTAAAVAVIAFWTFHVPVNKLREKRTIGIIVGSIVGIVLVVYFGRVAIPPVPMYLSHGAVGPEVLDDGRLAMEVKTLASKKIRQIMAVTDIVVPGGKGDKLRHVWRQNGNEVHGANEDGSRVKDPASGTVRMRSSLAEGALPPHLAGSWSVDVETEDGQLVGRTTFSVFD